MPRKIIEEVDEWTKEGNKVKHIQVERTLITLSKIREASVEIQFSRVQCILHGWPPKENIPEDLTFYFNQQDEFSVEDGCLLRGSRVVIPAKYQASVLSELHLNHPGTVRMKSLAGLHV